MDDIVAKFKETVFDSGAIDAIVMTNDLTIVWMSPTLEKEFGPLKDFIGRKCHEVFTGEPEPHVDCIVRRTLASRAVERSVNAKRTYATVAVPLGEDHVAEVIVRLPEEE
jgi:hypothetical protein